MSETNFVKIFIQHLLFDKEFAKEIVLKHPIKIGTLGEYINKRWKEPLYMRKTIGKRSDEEFIDFIDGNGFIIDRSNPNYISITIVYEEPKYEKKKSPICMDVSIYQETLYDTSMDSVERYILEYKKLLASWTFWFRVCRRVELLRLVPKGRCGSSPVPRPP